MVIKGFNTNRFYTEAGQRIAYTVLSTGNVAMKDIDRCIDYILACGSRDRVTDEKVMYAYDNNVTVRTYSAEEQDEFYSVSDALYEFACNLPKRVAR